MTRNEATPALTAHIAFYLDCSGGSARATDLIEALHGIGWRAGAKASMTQARIANIAEACGFTADRSRASIIISN
jgi:hypothetical protein